MLALVEISALLLPDYGYFLTVDAGKSANDRRVIGIPPIAVNLLKLRKYRGKNVQ
jgi:hypothetical protein